MGYQVRLITDPTPTLSPTERIKALADDWAFYSNVEDQSLRYVMQQCVVIELEHELALLRCLCEEMRESSRRQRRFRCLRRESR